MKIGIAGAGMIVPPFLDAAARVDSMEIYALYARRAEVRRELCDKYRIPTEYDSYENMLADPEVDTVYVALPNTLHFPFAKQALEAGKHVILEKPFTVTWAEARELADLAREKKLYLFEAITTQYNPNYEKMRELLPQLGDVKIVQLNFSQYSSRYDKFKEGIISPVFDPEQAGGALTDISIYNIHFVAGLFGKPVSVHYYPNMERGVDTSGVLVMQYPGFQAVCVGSKDCGAPLCLSVSVQGDKGVVYSTDAPSILAEFLFQKNKGETERFALADAPERLYYELAAFAKYYQEKDAKAFDQRLEHSLMVMEILDMARDPKNQG